MQQLRDESVCKYCNQLITDNDAQNNNLTMLQSTDCFHQVHIDCFKEAIIKAKANYEPVKCPRCGAEVQDFELNQYLTKEEQAEIEKSQRMNIIKMNPNLISCSCGNIMEMQKGEVIRGQKDDKG